MDGALLVACEVVVGLHINISRYNTITNYSMTCDPDMTETRPFVSRNNDLSTFHYCPHKN